MTYCVTVQIVYPVAVETMMKTLFAISGMIVLLFGLSAEAQSLRGSRSSVNRQERQAQAHDFTFMETSTRVQRFVDAGLIVQVRGNGNYGLHDVSYPYARPAVKVFIERLSAQFRAGCGETLTVTSLTRPLSEQPSNASDQSVHPTGMALDLRIPRTSRCREWLNSVLLSLEAKGVLEATRERNPAHYHVAIFPNLYEAYVASLESGPREEGEYVVRRGDSLWEIARRIGTSVGAIVAANGLNGDRIFAGQVLRLPH
jgi:hypothetical protein